MAEPQITGFVLHVDSLETTTLVGTRKRVFDGDSRFSGTPAECLRAAVAAKRLEGALHGALPASATLLNVLDLPSRDPQEIGGMVSLRAEEWTPFAVERTCVGWEILAETPAGCRVGVALAPLAAVQALREGLVANGLSLQRVDVDVFAWLRLLADANALPLSGHQLLLLLHRDQTHLVLLGDGVPLLFRALGNTRDVEEDDLRGELSTALSSVEAEWGVSALDGLGVFHDGDPPSWAHDLVAGLPCTVSNLSALPPLSDGVALRGVSGARLDLSPPQWREDEKRRLQRKRLLRSVIAAAAVWVLAVGGLVLFVQFRERQVRGLREQARRQEKPVADITSLGGRVRSLSQFTDRSHSALEALRLMAEAMPADGSLRVTDFQYRKEQGMTLSGEALAGDAAFYNFIENLAGSGAIRVGTYDVKQQRGRTEFQVNVSWNWGDAPGEGGS